MPDEIMRVARLVCWDEEPLFIRGNPSREAVKEFVAEHNRRYMAGEPGGPGGAKPRRIISAALFDDELSALDPSAKGKPINIKALLVKET